MSTGCKTGNVLTRRADFSAAVFQKLWEEQRTLKEIGDRFNVSEATVCKTAQLLKLKSRARLAEEAAMEWTPEDPTLEEIYARAAEIRAGWSKEETERRIVVKSGAALLRTFVFNGNTNSFAYAG